ncbi:MAG: hypothetical protein AB7I01_01945 [Gammaproteobacteria bacterium]
MKTRRPTAAPPAPVAAAWLPTLDGAGGAAPLAEAFSAFLDRARAIAHLIAVEPDASLDVNAAGETLWFLAVEAREFLNAWRSLQHSRRRQAAGGAA